MLAVGAATAADVCRTGCLRWLLAGHEVVQAATADDDHDHSDACPWNTAQPRLGFGLLHCVYSFLPYGDEEDVVKYKFRPLFVMVSGSPSSAPPHQDQSYCQRIAEEPPG